VSVRGGGACKRSWKDPKGRSWEAREDPGELQTPGSSAPERGGSKRKEGERGGHALQPKSSMRKVKRAKLTSWRAIPARKIFEPVSLVFGSREVASPPPAASVFFCDERGGGDGVRSAWTPARVRAWNERDGEGRGATKEWIGRTDEEGSDVREDEDLCRPSGGDPEVPVHAEVPDEAAEEDVVGREHSTWAQNGEQVEDDVDAGGMLFVDAARVGEGGTVRFQEAGGGRGDRGQGVRRGRRARVRGRRREKEG